MFRIQYLRKIVSEYLTRKIYSNNILVKKVLCVEERIYGKGIKCKLSNKRKCLWKMYIMTSCPLIYVWLTHYLLKAHFVYLLLVYFF